MTTCALWDIESLELDYTVCIKQTEIRYKASILMLYIHVTVLIHQVMVASCADH